ncbi:MAG: sugar nucleotide-binding protein [Chloroflexi bacterium]|nr:sugar nucleotide-binding protein [Chloroflexota bacterium]
MKRLLITGGSGYLGARLTALADEAGAWEVTPTFLANPIPHPAATRADLRDREAVAALGRRVRPDVIIHQGVSNRSDEHVAAIVPAARHIMDAAIATGARLIHVSTDLVFDGEHPPYSEQSPVAPVNPYGAAKAYAEGLIAGAMPEALIVRPSLIYGFGPVDKQTAWLLDGVRRGQPVRLFTDEIRCPVWVDTLALALLELAESKLTGVLNIAGPPLNRWDFGMKMLACLGVPPGPTVARSTIAESGLQRPADLTMDASKARRLLRTHILTVEEAFAAHCAQPRRP